MKVSNQGSTPATTPQPATAPETPAATGSSKFSGVLAKKTEGESEGQAQAGTGAEASTPGAERGEMPGTWTSRGTPDGAVTALGKEGEAMPVDQVPGDAAGPVATTGKSASGEGPMVAPDTGKTFQGVLSAKTEGTKPEVVAAEAEKEIKTLEGREAEEATGDAEGEPAGKKMDLETTLPLTPAPGYQPVQFTADLPVQAPEAPRPLHDARIIRSLVQEIHLVAHPGGRTEMEIQLNSKTLEGLQIRIGHEDGKLNIVFSTKSDDVSQLLNRNMANLTQSLAARGLQVANLQVVNVPFAAMPQQPVQVQPAFRGGQRGSDSDRGGRQGRGQGGQQRGRR